MGITVASVVVMPLLVFAKRRTGRELRSATVVADSTQTMLCTYLSMIVLAGLLLNAVLVYRRSSARIVLRPGGSWGIRPGQRRAASAVRTSCNYPATHKSGLIRARPSGVHGIRWTTEGPQGDMVAIP